jgi:hypothetical protein
MEKIMGLVIVGCLLTFVLSPVSAQVDSQQGISYRHDEPYERSGEYNPKCITNCIMAERPQVNILSSQRHDRVLRAQSFETQTIILTDVPNSFPMFSNAEYVNFTIEHDTITLTLDSNACFDGVCNLPNLIGYEITAAKSAVELEYYPITYLNYSYDQKWRSAPYFDDTENKLYLLSGSGLIPKLTLDIKENAREKRIPKVVGVGDLVGDFNIATIAKTKNSTYNNLTSNIAGVGYANLYVQYAPDTSYENTPFIPSFTQCEQLQESIDSIICGSESTVDYLAHVLGMANGAVPISGVSHDWDLALALNVEYYPITYQDFSQDQKWDVLPYFNDTENRLYLLSGSGSVEVELELKENAREETIPKVVGVGGLVGELYNDTIAQGIDASYNDLVSDITGVGYANLYVQYAPDASETHPAGGKDEIAAQITAGADDGFVARTPEVFRADSTGITIGTDLKFDAFLRFPDLKIPANATITKAYISVVPAVTNPAGPMMHISAADVADPSVPTTSSDFYARKRTASSVNWDASSWAAGESYPDLFGYCGRRYRESILCGF